MRYSDTWHKRIPQIKLIAYKWLIDEGKIREPQVVYNKTTGVTVVTYESDLPHEDIKAELRSLSEEWQAV